MTEYTELGTGEPIDPHWVCHSCADEDHMTGVWAEERYSFGIYAGKYCDTCWAQSGYRDATDPTATFDPADAGEALEPEDY